MEDSTQPGITKGIIQVVPGSVKVRRYIDEAR